MGFFKKLAEAAHSVDIDSIANKMDEAINSATNKIDSAINSLDKKLDGNNGSEVNDVRPSYSADDAFVVPEGVTEIDEETFEDYNGESVIVLPSTLEEIDTSSFEQCEKVKYIDLSKVTKLTTIPDYLFSGLKKITEITIPEGVTEIGDCVFDNCERLRKVVLSSTLESIEGGFYECKNLQKIVFSDGIKIKSLPDYLLPSEYGERSFVIPYGVETVGDPINAQGVLEELYVPATVKEIGNIFEDSECKTDVYLYSYDIDDIEDLCTDAKTLYVMPEAYDHYQALIDNREDPDNNEVELKIMPSNKRNLYGEPKPVVRQQPVAQQPQPVMPQMPEEPAPAQVVVPPIPAPPIPTETAVPPMPAPAPLAAPAVEAPQVVKRPGQLFSDGLEELINAAVASGEITDKKREIILRRAIKEGEDPDEVEMILDARLYEANNK